MTKQELERYLEIKTVLELHEIEVGKDGFMSCPFHANCEQSMKLYEELNGVACMRSSCNNYRKIFDAYQVLQELKGFKAEEARIYGKSLLLKELENLRALVKVEESNLLIEEEEGLEVLPKGGMEFLKDLRSYLKKANRKTFTSQDLRDSFKIARSTLIKYLKILEANEVIKILSGNRYNGYKYSLEE